MRDGSGWPFSAMRAVPATLHSTAPPIHSTLLAASFAGSCVAVESPEGRFLPVSRRVRSVLRNSQSLSPTLTSTPINVVAEPPAMLGMSINPCLLPLFPLPFSAQVLWPQQAVRHDSPPSLCPGRPRIPVSQPVVAACLVGSNFLALCMHRCVLLLLLRRSAELLHHAMLQILWLRRLRTCFPLECIHPCPPCSLPGASALHPLTIHACLPALCLHSWCVCACVRACVPACLWVFCSLQGPRQ